jgi:uncharacterized membrane protein YphA (DoxX/SURF4 family)
MLGTRPWRRPQLPAHGSASPNGASVIAHRFREFAPPPQFGQMVRLVRSLCGTGGLVLVASIGAGRYAVRPRS